MYLKSVWRTFNWFWSLTSHLQIRPSARRLEITFLSCIMPLPLSQRKKCFTARKHEEVICCLRAWSICCSLFLCMAGSRMMFFSRWFQYFVFMAKWPNWFNVRAWLEPPRKAKGGNFKGHEDWESNQEPLLTQAAAVSGQLKGEAFGFVPIVSFFLKN